MNNTKFDMLICPKCKEALHQEGNSLRCTKNHCYDIASAGYVNLLPPHKKGDIPGDGKDMVRARREFLYEGYYKPLRDKIAEFTERISPKTVADIGCGEGYYTSVLSKYADKVMGFDISKFALQYAAKLDKVTDYCTANLHELPLDNGAADMVLCCFCAHDEKEFRRILKESGSFVLITPGKRHLFGLKTVLYDEPYENEENELLLDGFEVLRRERVYYTAEISTQKAINDLFMMTPYYWRSPKSGAESLARLNVLITELDFIITEYKAI